MRSQPASQPPATTNPRSYGQRKGPAAACLSPGSSHHRHSLFRPSHLLHASPIFDVLCCTLLGQGGFLDATATAAAAVPHTAVASSPCEAATAALPAAATSVAAAAARWMCAAVKKEVTAAAGSVGGCYKPIPATAR
jgi:hypothetical protein